MGWIIHTALTLESNASMIIKRQSVLPTAVFDRKEAFDCWAPRLSVHVYFTCNLSTTFREKNKTKRNSYWTLLTRHQNQYWDLSLRCIVTVAESDTKLRTVILILQIIDKVKKKGWDFSSRRAATSSCRAFVCINPLFLFFSPLTHHMATCSSRGGWLC